MHAIIFLFSFYSIGCKQLIQIKEIKARFVNATVWERSGSYYFKDKRGNEVVFAFDSVNDQKVDYQLLGEEALPNQKYIDVWFAIKYKTITEQRGESEEWITVKKIVEIKMISRDK